MLRRPLPSRRGVVRGLVYGLVFYAVQALLLFSAVDRIDPGPRDPAASTCSRRCWSCRRCWLGRDRFSWRRVAAIPVALTGVALVLIGPGVGAVDALGATLALLAAVAYVAFVLAGDYLAVGTDPVVLAALMATGAIPTFIVLRPDHRRPVAGFQSTGWIWIVAVAFVSLVAFTMFFAGLERVGPSLTGLLSTSEPVATTIASAVIFGDTLTPVQGVGGAS